MAVSGTETTQAANAADDLAIAADKHPLLPGGFAQFPNITNYTRGIDGLMIDIAGLSGSPTLADFRFCSGQHNGHGAMDRDPGSNRNVGSRGIWSEWVNSV